MDIRKIIIIFVVAILFTVLVFSVIEAVYPHPEYDDFCKEEFPVPREIKPVVVENSCPPITIKQEDQKSCNEKNGDIQYVYDSNGCATNYKCSTCRNEYETAEERYAQYVFYISAVLSLLAIFIGLYLPAKKNSLHEWIGTGFMLGGTFALFFGTIISFSDLGRFIRPVVIFLELILIIFIAYRKIGNLREDKAKK